MDERKDILTSTVACSTHCLTKMHNLNRENEIFKNLLVVQSWGYSFQE